MLTVANQSNITGVGAITSGSWTADAIASAYLDADTAHLSTHQTFTGRKTFEDKTGELSSRSCPKLDLMITGVQIWLKL